MDVVAETGEDAAQSKAQRRCGNEPARPNPFARNLEEDVADIESRQDGIVVVSLEVEIFFETGKTGVANVGSVDETCCMSVFRMQ